MHLRFLSLSYIRKTESKFTLDYVYKLRCRDFICGAADIL